MDSSDPEGISDADWVQLRPDIEAALGGLALEGVDWSETAPPVQETRLRFNSLVPAEIHELELLLETGKVVRVVLVWWPGEALWEVEEVG